MDPLNISALADNPDIPTSIIEDESSFYICNPKPSTKNPNYIGLGDSF